MISMLKQRCWINQAMLSLYVNELALLLYHALFDIFLHVFRYVLLRSFYYWLLYQPFMQTLLISRDSFYPGDWHYLLKFISRKTLELLLGIGVCLQCRVLLFFI